MKIKSRWALLLVVPLVAALSMLTFTGCEDDDHDSADGTATVQGNVNDYAFGETLQAGVVPGVLVVLEPGGYEAETDENGNFVIANVPAGSYTIWFYHNGQRASHPLEVEDGKTYTLRNVVVDENGNVRWSLGSSGHGSSGETTYGTATLVGSWSFSIMGMQNVTGHSSSPSPVEIYDCGGVYYGGTFPFSGQGTLKGDAVYIEIYHADAVSATGPTAFIYGTLGGNAISGTYMPTWVDDGGGWAAVTSTMTYPLSGSR